MFFQLNTTNKQCNMAFLTINKTLLIKYWLQEFMQIRDPRAGSIMKLEDLDSSSSSGCGRQTQT